MNFKEQLLAMPEGADFKAKRNDASVCRARRYRDDSIFVFGKGARVYGRIWSIDEFLTCFTPMLQSAEDIENDWHKRCKVVETRLEKSGLWPELKNVFHNLQLVARDDFDAIIKHSRAYMHPLPGRQELYTEMQVKYPFMFRTLDSGEVVVNSDYVEDVCVDIKTKSMHFGDRNKYYKRQIGEALASKQEYHSPILRSRYDVSFHYDPKTNRATYSEEYRGCGNGHYYLALDNSMALFYEND